METARLTATGVPAVTDGNKAGDGVTNAEIPPPTVTDTLDCLLSAANETLAAVALPRTTVNSAETGVHAIGFFGGGAPCAATVMPASKPKTPLTSRIRNRLAVI